MNSLPDEQAPQATTDQAATEEHQPEVSAAEPVAAETSPQPGSDATSSEPAGEADEKSPGLPGLRVQIGSLGDPSVARDARPKPAVLQPGPNVQPPAADQGEERPKPPVGKKKFPPPKLSRELSPELERELEAALGGMSLDSMLDARAPGANSGELEPETRIAARVVGIHRDNVFMDLGGQNQGIVPLKNFTGNPEVGSVMDVTVTRFNAEDGLYEVGLPGAAVDVGNWSEVAEGMIVQATVTGHNKGGLECNVSSLRGFMPVSQIALFRVDDMQQFVGQSFAALVTEADPERRNLVLSRRAVLEREAAEAKIKMLAELAVGQTREGVVRSLQNFGAFVDMGGVDGLIHISQLSWDRVNHASEVLQIGQKVKVRIEKFDRETGKIGLSYRELGESPWKTAPSKYHVGTRVTGTVSKLMEFGAFVKLEPGVEGLIHISELSHKRVWRASDVVKEGEQVEVQILTVDGEAQRISLSLKALETKPTVASKEQQKEDEAREQLEASQGVRAKPKGPLKGGLGGPSGGSQFGLKW